MKRKRFTEEQIIGVLKESEAGAKTDDICRRHGSAPPRVSCLAEEVRRHGCIRGQTAAGAGDRECQAQADRGGSTAGHVVDEGTAGKKLVTPMAKREAVGFLMSEIGLSERRACRIVGLARSVQQYRPLPKDDAAAIGLGPVSPDTQAVAV